MDELGVEVESYAMRLTVMFLASFVCALLSYHTIEKAFLNLKKYFPYFEASKDLAEEEKSQADAS